MLVFKLKFDFMENFRNFSCKRGLQDYNVEYTLDILEVINKRKKKLDVFNDNFREILFEGAIALLNSLKGAFKKLETPILSLSTLLPFLCN